jgi:uncharacterized protein (TIGR00106 family)
MLVEFSLIPAGIGPSLSKYIAKAVEIIDSSGLNYKVTSMGSIVEGEWDEIFDLIKKCRDALMKESERLFINIIIDDRKGKTNRLEGKLRSLEEKLGRKLN